MPDKPRVLFVDDSVNLINAVSRVLRKKIDLVAVESAAEALKTLEEQEPFDVLISDQNMPQMKGVALLAEAAQRWPLTTRVMLTGNDDQSTAIAAVNSGQVFRFVRKPCDADALMEVVNAAAEHHRVMAAEKELMEKTLAGSVKVLSDMLSFLRPGLFDRSAKVRKCAAFVAKRAKLAHGWELDLAAMLYPLGYVALPNELADKYARGMALSAPEQDMVDHSVEVAAKLVDNIPRLGAVANIIRHCRKGFDGSGFPLGGDEGKQLPLKARILHILIDLVDALEQSGNHPDRATELLKAKQSIYDPEIFPLILDCIGYASRLFERGQGDVIAVAPSMLVEGDILQNDIRDKEDRLLLAAGSPLTELSTYRLAHLARSGAFDGMVKVFRPSSAGQSAA